MRLLLFCSIVALIGAEGCTRPATERDAGDHSDMGRAPMPDVGPDVGATHCTNDSQCNDGVACTLDQCVVGNVCQPMPLDSLCDTTMGEHCDAARGCVMGSPSDCNTAVDCDDHDFCNGDERCVDHNCLAGLPRNCDDGNPCTIDSCDSSAASCSYVMTCDSGVVTTDAGPTCTTFTSPDDFNGTFGFVPAQSQACGSVTYDVSQITVTVSGTSVTVVTGTSGPITMTGTFTGSSFDVTGMRGMGTFHLVGTFSCRERFTGHWTATVSGFGCVNQDVDVRGSRR